MAAVNESRFRAVLSLRRFQPLAAVGFPLRQVAGQLYAGGDGVYVLARTTDQSLREAPDGPLVHSVGWAPTDSAARRAFLLELDADDGTLEDIPADLAFGWTDLSYESILTNAKAEGREPIVTTASYDSSRRFVHRAIGVERTLFLFRSHTDQPAEAPYAVVVHPR